MSIVISIFGLVIGATIAKVAWDGGFSQGYALGVAHGKESAEADRSLEVWPRSIVSAPLSAQDITGELVAAIDRKRNATLGPNATRADALELM